MKLQNLFQGPAFFLLFVILLVFGVTEARNILYPISFGVLIAYLLLPLASRLEKNRVPRILAILISIFLLLLIFATIFFLFYRQLSNLFADFDQIKTNANQNVENLLQKVETYLGIETSKTEAFLKEQLGNLLSNTSSLITSTMYSTTNTLFRLIILPVYVFLFLYYRTKFARFILKIVRPDGRFKTIEILREVAKIAGRYISGVSVVVLILSVLNTTGLLIIGMDYAILLGIVSAFFNFIPYFGTLIGGAVPFMYALIGTADPLFFAPRVLILFAVIQFTENNILTPNIVGNNVKISPLFIIIGLVLGATLWGIPGMLVVVPFLAIIRIIASHIDRLKPLAFLLGLKGTKKHRIRLSFFKSLLTFRKSAKHNQDV